MNKGGNVLYLILIQHGKKTVSLEFYFLYLSSPNVHLTSKVINVGMLPTNYIK